MMNIQTWDTDVSVIFWNTTTISKSTISEFFVYAGKRKPDP